MKFIKRNNLKESTILTEGTRYDEQAAKIISNSGLFSPEVSKQIIDGLFREDIHAFNHAPNWLEKYPQWNYDAGFNTIHCTDGDIKERKNESLNKNIIKEALEIHKELNQKLFKDNKLKPEISEALLNIATTFIENVWDNNIPLELIDIWLVGSNASYNYSNKSDIDIHIIVNMEDFDSNEYLLKLIYDYVKSDFNKSHNITVKGLPVELYIEDQNTSSITNGIYSILDNKWVKEPKQLTIPDIDIENEELYKSYLNKYETIIQNPDLDTIQEFINELYKLRKQSLSAEGEFGLGNLVFKEFRNNEYLDNLKNIKRELVDKTLTLEKLEESDNQQKKYYHISNNPNLTKEDIVLGTEGFHITSSKDVLENRSTINKGNTIYEIILKDTLQNPLIIKFDLGRYNATTLAKYLQSRIDGVKMPEFEDLDIESSPTDNIINELTDTEKKIISELSQLKGDKGNLQQITDILKKHNYDHILYRNDFENNLGEEEYSIALLDPQNQIENIKQIPLTESKKKQKLVIGPGNQERAMAIFNSNMMTGFSNSSGAGICEKFSNILSYKEALRRAIIYKKKNPEINFCYGQQATHKSKPEFFEPFPLDEETEKDMIRGNFNIWVLR